MLRERDEPTEAMVAGGSPWGHLGHEKAAECDAFCVEYYRLMNRLGRLMISNTQSGIDKKRHKVDPV
jgi:hypothetical protein